MLDETTGPVPAGAFKSFLLEQLIAQRVHYDTNTPELRGENAAQFARWNALAGMREIGELVDLVAGWKPWDTVNRGENAGRIKDRDKFIDEGVDVLKFVGNLLLLAGVTDRELSEAWRRKTQVNALRQERGYAGVGEEFVLTDDDIERLHDEGVLSRETT